MQSGLEIDLTNRDVLNDEYLEGKLEPLAGEKFESFTFLRQTLACSVSEVAVEDALISVRRPSEIPVDVVCINSAWMTWGGLEQQKRDERRLLVPEAAIKKALHALGEHAGRRRLLLIHHPANWFAEYAESDFLDVIDGQFDFHLFGHIHEPRPASVCSLRGRQLLNQGGALYTGRGRYNGYAVITFDLQNGNPAVYFRSYFDKPRREFDAGIDLTKDGTFFPTPEARNFWQRKARRVDQGLLRSWIINALHPAAETSWNEGIADRPICEVFVPPPMYTRTVLTDHNDDGLPYREEIPITLDEILEGSGNLIIHGKQEYGKTTFLHQLAIRLIRRQVDHPDKSMLSVPVIIDFGEIRSGHNRIQRVLQAGLPTTLDGNCPFLEILEQGLATILIDDVIFTDAERQRLLKGFISKYPRNRYIFTTLADSPDRLVVVGEDVVVDPGVPVSFSHIFLKPFTRKKMRSLVEKWDRDGSIDKDAVLDRMTKEFAGINLPVTAVNGTILLIIYEAESGYRPINRAALIERFIEHLLEKQSLRDAERRSFDFTNKVGVLSHLAAEMARDDNYCLTHAKVVDIVRKYLDSVGLSQDPEALVETFTASRVLAKRSDARLSFRYRAFLEYFIASQMQIDLTFKSWVLEEDRYLSYINEIQHYAAMGRRDVELLALIAERFNRLAAAAASEMKWSPNLALIDTFQPPRLDSTADLVDEFERQMQAPPLTQEERDELLEAELPQDADQRQEVFRPRMEHLGHKWITALLLYSGVLKNLEIIPDALKRTHLANILAGWSMFTIQSLWVVPQLAKHRRLKVNGILYDVNLPRHYSEAKVARTIYVDMPNAVGRVLTSTLGTEKLERQLTEPTLDEVREPLIMAYYRYSLVADLRLGQWCRSLEALVKQLREKSPYLLESFARKAGDLYLFGGHPPEDEAQLRRMVGEMVASLRGHGHRDRAKLKGKHIQNIERQALLRRLQIAARDTQSSSSAE